MYGWMDACMQAWMDGWISGWMCAYVCVCVYVCMCGTKCPTGIAPAHPMPLGGHRSTDCHVLGLRHHGLRPVYTLRHLSNSESISMYADICVFMFLLMLIPVPMPILILILFILMLKFILACMYV